MGGFNLINFILNMTQPFFSFTRSRESIFDFRERQMMKYPNQYGHHRQPYIETWKGVEMNIWNKTKNKIASY